MGSRTPVDDRHAEIPASLADTVIGDDTAQEIGLLRPWKQHPKGASHRALLAPESTAVKGPNSACCLIAPPLSG